MKEYNDRIERLLVLILLSSMKDASLKEKAKTLNVAGLTNNEIAEILDTSAQVVANYLSKSKKDRKIRRSI